MNRSFLSTNRINHNLHQSELNRHSGRIPSGFAAKEDSLRVGPEFCVHTQVRIENLWTEALSGVAIRARLP